LAALQRKFYLVLLWRSGVVMNQSWITFCHVETRGSGIASWVSSSCRATNLKLLQATNNGGIMGAISDVALVGIMSRVDINAT